MFLLFKMLTYLQYKSTISLKLFFEMVNYFHIFNPFETQNIAIAEVISDLIA